jgi:hypothetical protein
VASVVGVGPATPPPPPPPPLPGAKVPVVSINCCGFDGEFVAEDVPVLDGDVKGVDGTNAEELLLPDGVVNVGAKGIDAREESAEEDTTGGVVSWGEIDGSEILPENRCTGGDRGGESLEEAVEEPEGFPGAGVTAGGRVGVEDPRRDEGGVEEASGGFADKGVMIRIGGGEVGEADDTAGAEGSELDPEDPREVTPPELLDEESDIEDEPDVDKEIERVGVHEDVEVPVELAELTEEVVEVAGQPLNV